MRIVEGPVHLFWSKFDHLRLPTIRDACGRSMQPYTDYFDSFADEFADSTEQAARSTIEARTYALHALALFLCAGKRPLALGDISDGVLKKFKKWELNRVRSNAKSRGDLSQAKDTVNVKLRSIYQFINWSQKNYAVPSETIGPVDCKVISTIPLIEREPNISKHISSPECKFPLLYTSTGRRNTASGTGQHWATEDDIERLEDIFWDSATSVAVRNTTMLRILDVNGWRIGSANSLTCDQFSDEQFKRWDGHTNFGVIPPVQKFGAFRTFEMPWALANRIREYIHDGATGRKSIADHVETRSGTVTTDHIFISVKDGCAMATNAWSGIFGDAFRRIGTPKGTAAHALRRGAGERRANQLIDALTESGLPVTEECVTAELMQFLGHSTKQAQASYFRALRRRRSHSQVDALATALEARTLEGDRLRAEFEKARLEMESLRAENQALMRAIKSQQRAKSRSSKSKATKAHPTAVTV